MKKVDAACNITCFSSNTSLIYLESVRTDRTLKPPGMLLKTSACSVRQTKTDRVFVHREEEWDRQKEEEKERLESALSRPVSHYYAIYYF